MTACTSIKTDLTSEEALSILEPYFDAVRDDYVAAGLDRCARTRLVIDPAMHDTARHFAACQDDGKIILLAPELAEIDDKAVIDTTYAPYAFSAGDYELLWVGFGYNTTKDGVPFFLQHWDNFGFDGPVSDQRTVHNYVTQIEGTDFQAGRRGAPVDFTINIPDDLRPVDTETIERTGKQQDKLRGPCHWGTVTSVERRRARPDAANNMPSSIVNDR